MLDDSFRPEFCPEASPLPSSRCFVFHEEEILLHKKGNEYSLPVWEEVALLEQPFCVGRYGDIPCFAIELSEKPAKLPSSLYFEAVRQAHGLLDGALFSQLFRARQLLNWDKSTRFCGRCGQANQLAQREYSKQCTACQSLTFPHIAPAMLVLVWRKDEILLARSPHFKPGMYSLIAGFVDPGETLEQTVMREVEEEAGIHVKNLRYVGSQPWPFPSNLMLGFTAEYDHGELRVDPQELEDAKWFKINQLPPLPQPISLSRSIIDNYLAQLSV